MYGGHWTFLWQFTTFTASRMLSSLRKFLEFLLSPASLMRRSGILTVHLFYMIKQEYSLCYCGEVINHSSTEKALSYDGVPSTDHLRTPTLVRSFHKTYGLFESVYSSASMDWFAETCGIHNAHTNRRCAIHSAYFQ